MESGVQYAVGSLMLPTWEAGYLDTSATSVFTASNPPFKPSQNKALTNGLSSSAPCNRDGPETEQKTETCPLCSPKRGSPRFHALALLALKSYSNSYRELSRWDSPWIDPPRRFPQSQGLQDYRVCSCRAGRDAKTSRQSLLEPRAWKSRYNLGSGPRSTAGSLEARRSPATARALQARWFLAARLRLRAGARGTVFKGGQTKPKCKLSSSGPSWTSACIMEQYASKTMTAVAGLQVVSCSTCWNKENLCVKKAHFFSEPSSFGCPASRNLLEIQNTFWFISSTDGKKI